MPPKKQASPERSKSNQNSAPKNNFTLHAVGAILLSILVAYFYNVPLPFTSGPGKWIGNQHIVLVANNRQLLNLDTQKALAPLVQGKHVVFFNGAPLWPKLKSLIAKYSLVLTSAEGAKALWHHKDYEQLVCGAEEVIVHKGSEISKYKESDGAANKNLADLVRLSKSCGNSWNLTVPMLSSYPTEDERNNTALEPSTRFWAMAHYYRQRYNVTLIGFSPRLEGPTPVPAHNYPWESDTIQFLVDTKQVISYFDDEETS